MRSLPRRLVLAFLCLVFATIPAQGADREHQQMTADIRMLQEQTVRLHLLLGALDATLHTLLDRLDSQAHDTRRAFADQKLLVDNVTTGVRVIREKVDETNVRVSSLSQEVEALRLSIPPMGTFLTELPVDPETGLPLPRPEPSMPAPTALNPGVSPQRLYDTAYADYTTGQWALSIQGFEAYISAFPRSELADDARFFIGQNYYADGELREAADAFEQVVLSYPEGDVVAEALYKRGLTLERLEEPGLAKEAFELVVENYPDDNMANLAQQALNRLE